MAEKSSTPVYAITEGWKEDPDTLPLLKDRVLIEITIQEKKNSSYKIETIEYEQDKMKNDIHQQKHRLRNEK